MIIPILGIVYLFEKVLAVALIFCGSTDFLSRNCHNFATMLDGDGSAELCNKLILKVFLKL